MQITIPLIVDVPDSGTINDVEELMAEASLRAMAEALHTYMSDYEERHKLCPFCSGNDIHRTGSDRRVLSLRMGRVELSLHRWRCQRCKRRFRLADRLFALLAANACNSEVKSKSRSIANGHQPKSRVTSVVPWSASAEWEVCQAWQEFPR
jgi:hypothetical protein